MFSEPFEIVVHIGEDPKAISDEGSFKESFLRDIEAELADLIDPDEPFEHEHSSVGRGADSTAILLAFAALTVFFQGKRIEENFDAWLSMSRRLLATLKRISRFGHTYLSEPAGAAIALTHIVSEDPSIRQAKLLTSEIVVVDPTGFYEHAWNSFRAIPERYYLYTFAVSDGDTHVICVKSTGEVHFHHALPSGNWQSFYGISDSLDVDRE